MSVATENFIKAIFQYSQDATLNTKPSTIAQKLGVSSAAATDMAKKLDLKELVVYQKYKPLVLTKKGEFLALKVIRKHRIWEAFLYQCLGLSLHEIHREAELLEHQTSDFLAEKLHEFLGFPNFDPHGDPIPNKKGILTPLPNEISLHTAKENETYQITRLQSSDKDFFDFCSDAGLSNGVELLVQKQFSKPLITKIQIGTLQLLLPMSISSKIKIVHQSDL